MGSLAETTTWNRSYPYRWGHEPMNALHWTDAYAVHHPLVTLIYNCLALLQDRWVVEIRNIFRNCVDSLAIWLKELCCRADASVQDSLEGTENSVYLEVLLLFAHGTWSDYKSNSSSLPQLHPDQVLKLKQLTVLTLSEANKVLPYYQLMLELDVTNVRELEDFIINECIYAGIVRGKLDQMRRCFEVQFDAGRDLRPGQLGSMIQTPSNWLGTPYNLLISIQEKIKWADSMSELDKKHRKEVDDRVEEVKKSISVKTDDDFRGLEEIYSEPGGVMDYEEDRIRSKR
ncbi:COP9 signalosome complex subunit 7-like [Hibiscus syriacus]|uniref:COP9 signalosome complex subunit 7-like n=1 Tax=Hibiscus syriacus TaxID=106335 RepID=UPI0019213A64|nr:COP9 signalosome complex subunit 7-like [Hibiscus syriacus]